MTQKPTPEEKLFAVIQGAQQASPRARAQALSLATLGTYLQAVMRQADLPRINRALSFLIAGLSLWCILSPLVFRPRMDRVLKQARRESAPFVVAPPLEGLKAPNDYIGLMRAKDPFRVGEVPLAKSPAAALPTPNVQALLNDFKLVGIAKGAVPHAMIEHVSQQTTHVLKAGDPIGPFTVKDVLEDRVILQHGTQELELF